MAVPPSSPGVGMRSRGGRIIFFSSEIKGHSSRMEIEIGKSEEKAPYSKAKGIQGRRGKNLIYPIEYGYL